MLCGTYPAIQDVNCSIVISVHDASTLTGMGSGEQEFFKDFPAITAFLASVSRFKAKGRRYLRDNPHKLGFF